DLVLDPPAFPVREWEIVGIGADAKHGGVRVGRADRHRHRRYDEAETPAPLHGLTLVPGTAGCGAGAGVALDFTYAASSHICWGCKTSCQDGMPFGRPCAMDA